MSWILLGTHTNDTSLNGQNSSSSWRLQKNLYKEHSIPPYNDLITDGTSSTFFGYRCILLLQTGPNSNGNNFMALSGFEIYGEQIFSPFKVISPFPFPLSIVLPSAMQSDSITTA